MKIDIFLTKKINTEVRLIYSFNLGARKSFNSIKEHNYDTNRSASDPLFQENNCLANLCTLTSNSHDWK